METIKIVDKLTLRQEALRMAIATGTSYPISQAQQFEAYLLNDADLPEYDDTHKDFKEMLGKMQEIFTTPRSMWIPADDEMKPAKSVEVVCALRYGSKIEKALMTYDNELKKWYNGDDDGTTDHVAAWMPISEYRPL